MNTRIPGWSALVGAARQWRVAILLWAVNLLLAAWAVAPLTAALTGLLSHSLAAQAMTDVLQGAVIVDIAREFFKLGMPIVAGFLSAVVFVTLFQVFAVGGILGRLEADASGNREASTFAGFLSDGGHFAGRSLKLTAAGLLMLIPVGLVFKLLQVGLEAFARRSIEEAPVLWLELGAAFVAFPLWLVLRAVMDSARAHLYLERRSSVLQAVRYGLELVLTRSPLVLVGYVLAGAVPWICFAILFGIRLAVPESGVVGVMAGFLIGQAAVFARVYGSITTLNVTRLACRERAGRTQQVVDGPPLQRWRENPALAQQITFSPE